MGYCCRREGRLRPACLSDTAAEVSAQESVPLIVSGAPRSGTSLLYNLFDGHGDVTWLLNEGFLFEYLYDLGDSGVPIFLDAARMPLADFIGGLREKDVMPPLHQPYRQTMDRGSVSEITVNNPWSEEAFQAALKDANFDDVSGLWTHLVAAYGAALGQQIERFVCLKAADYGKSVFAALRWMPETRGVLIVRDPLRALDSLKRSRELRGERLLSWPAMAQAIADMQAMHRQVVALGNKIYWLRYEDLVTNPEPTMRALADWIGLTFEPSLLEPTMAGQSWPGISSFKPTKGIEETPSKRPIRALSDADVALAERHLADFKATFGYA